MMTQQQTMDTSLFTDASVEKHDPAADLSGKVHRSPRRKFHYQ